LTGIAVAVIWTAVVLIQYYGGLSAFVVVVAVSAAMIVLKGRS
jgi:hypothetical protein